MDALDGLLLGAIVAAVLLLRWLLLRWLDHLGSPRRKLKKLPLVKARDVRDGQACRLVGVVHRHPDHPPLTTRFGEREALIYSAALRSDDRNTDTAGIHFNYHASELRAVEAFFLEDDSGSVTVRPSIPGTERQLDLHRTRRLEGVPMSRVEALLASGGVGLASVSEGFPWGSSSLPADYHIWEMRLAEGDRAVVAGVCRREAGPAAGTDQPASYREAPSTAVICGDATRVLYVGSDEKAVAELER